MRQRVRHAWPAFLIGLSALAVAAPVGALTPGPEQLKAESGLRFNEGAGMGALRPETPDVWAGGEPGRRANLTVSEPVFHKKTHAPPPAGDPGGGGAAYSLGTKLLAGTGAAVGAVAIAGLAVCVWPLVAALGVGGAVAAAYTAYGKGDRGWKLAAKTAVGAAVGVASLAIIGAAAGVAAGRLLERLFKR